MSFYTIKLPCNLHIPKQKKKNLKLGQDMLEWKFQKSAGGKIICENFKILLSKFDSDNPF